MTSVAMEEYNFEVMVLVASVFSNCMAHRNFGVCFSYVPEYKQVQAPICEALNITKETSCIAISFNGSHGLEGKYWIYTQPPTHPPTDTHILTHTPLASQFSEIQSLHRTTLLNTESIQIFLLLNQI